MDDSNIIQHYLDYIHCNRNIKSLPRIAAYCGLTLFQLEEIIEKMDEDYFRIARRVVKARYEDRYPVTPSESNVLPFRRNT